MAEEAIEVVTMIVEIVPAKGNGLDDDLLEVFKSDGIYVDVGWFEEQGNHPTSTDVSFAEIINMHATGDGGRFIPRPVLETALNLFKPMDKEGLSAFSKWLDNPKQDPSQIVLNVIGEDMVRKVQSVFGSSHLSPIPSNPDPMIDTGATRDATSYRIKGKSITGG